MTYKIHQLAKLAGVSVRTLHYYDRIGLLKPAEVGDNGYRIYSRSEVFRLQEILSFRELGFCLTDIKTIVNSPNFNRNEALREQKRLLQMKVSRLNDLITTIDRSIYSPKGGENMDTKGMFAALGDKQLNEYMEEAKVRWGNTDAYKSSMEKVKYWTKEDYQRFKTEGQKFGVSLAKVMDKDINSSEVMGLIEKHYRGTQNFYDCSFEFYRKLAQMYVDDKRFKSYYDKFRPGLAQWLHKAINIYCDLKQK